MTIYPTFGIPAQQGWQCPVCQRVHAPFMPSCPCDGRGPQKMPHIPPDIAEQMRKANDTTQRPQYPSMDVGL